MSSKTETGPLFDFLVQNQTPLEQCERILKELHKLAALVDEIGKKVKS